MPLYEYNCRDCGDFEILRSLSQYNAPMLCPQCNVLAVKILSVPNINLNSGSFSAIDKINSAEPRLVKQKKLEPTKPRYQSTNNSSRPWMVSHAPNRF